MTTAAVVLAAGKGTRFKSDLPKVLHEAAGRSLLRWVLEALRPLSLERVVVVVGHQADAVAAEAKAAELAGLETVEQVPQNGTGHAVRVAIGTGALDGIDDVLVVPGDSPLLTPEVLAQLLERHRSVGAAVTLLTAHMKDPTGYGRVLREGPRVTGVVEDRDATDAQRAITEVNTSMYVFALPRLDEALRGVTAGNAQGEEYLTDAVAALASHRVDARVAAAELVAGVNDRSQLADAAAILRRRILDGHMREGVTVVDPATTYVDATVAIAAETVVLPSTHLEGRTRVGRGATVGPGCRLVDTLVEDGATVTYSVASGASIGPRATVGPFSYLRPGTRLERGSKAGAFVEMKNSTVGEDSKVPHLSYVGDTTIGRGANIGAATVTVNYDGYAKHRTVIGDGARIGSDTMLVAPVTVGSDAWTGAGSVITRDVPDGALAVERNEQRVVEGYAQRRRRAAEEAGDDR